MEICEAQREVRRTCIGGFPGLLISSLVWLVSAVLATWVSWRAAMWTLVLGGVFIFLCLEVMLRLVSRRPSSHPENPLTSFDAAIGIPPAAVVATGRCCFPGTPRLALSGIHGRTRCGLRAVMFLFGMWQFGALGICSCSRPSFSE